MLDGDLLLVFSFMVLLFLRQIQILKQPNKINYAPLMLGIGVIGGIVHFIIDSDTVDVVMLTKESLLSLLVGMLLYIVMYIINQAQLKESDKLDNDFSVALVEHVRYLKDFMNELDKKLSSQQSQDIEAQKEIRDRFKDDIQALDLIKINQDRFVEKFNEMGEWHGEIMDKFATFSEVQIPNLESIAHNQLDVLRVVEQEHFAELKALFSESMSSKHELNENIAKVKTELESIGNISHKISKAIVSDTTAKLSHVATSFASQMQLLNSHTEGMITSLLEGEERVSSIRKESEIIMKQMILSSTKMHELQNQSSELHKVYSTITELVVEVEMVKADYVKSQLELSSLSKDMKLSEYKKLEDMRSRIDMMSQEVESLSEVLVSKIEKSLLKLQEHYHIASETITPSVQVLANKANLKEYIDN